MEIVRQMRVLEEKKTETNDDGRRTIDVKDLHLEETRLMDYQHKLDCIQFIYILLIPQTILCVVSVCVCSVRRIVCHVCGCAECVECVSGFQHTFGH